MYCLLVAESRATGANIISKKHALKSIQFEVCQFFSDSTMASAQDEVLAIRKKLEKITEQGSDDSQAMDLLKNLSDIEM